MSLKNQSDLAIFIPKPVGLRAALQRIWNPYLLRVFLERWQIQEFPWQSNFYPVKDYHLHNNLHSTM